MRYFQIVSSVKGIDMLVSESCGRDSQIYDPFMGFMNMEKHYPISGHRIKYKEWPIERDQRDGFIRLFSAVLD